MVCLSLQPIQSTPQMIVPFRISGCAASDSGGKAEYRAAGDLHALAHGVMQHMRQLHRLPTFPNGQRLVQEQTTKQVIEKTTQSTRALR